MRGKLLSAVWLTVVPIAVVTSPVQAEPANGGQPLDGIGPVGPIEKVATGFGFTEGPAFRDGVLYFTDIPNTTIHRLASDGAVTAFTTDSRHANGLMFTPAGELLACEMEGQLVAYDVATGQRRVLASGFNGTRFNAPNDLVIDSHGGVYFTDPRFRSPQPFPQGGQHVYYRAADGAVSRVTPKLPAPNGVSLSRDESTLYVFPSDNASMRAYDITSPGKARGGREFCRVRQKPGSRLRGSDGVALDVRGNLYLTTVLGVQVFDPRGELLGIIPLPEKPSNVTFGGADRKTLYATAQTSVYAIPMAVAGHVFGETKSGVTSPAGGGP